eukprot:6046488-Prymnesium_polylepis.1
MHRLTAAICISERSSAPLVRATMSPGASPPITSPASRRWRSWTIGRSGLGFSPEEVRTTSFDERRPLGKRVVALGATAELPAELAEPSAKDGLSELGLGEARKAAISDAVLVGGVRRDSRKTPPPSDEAEASEATWSERGVCPRERAAVSRRCVSLTRIE